MTSEEFDAVCNEFMEKLGEHADAIQILASFYTGGDAGETFCRKIGVGNWYARQGMAREFIEQNQAQTNAREISDALNPPDE